MLEILNKIHSHLERTRQPLEEYKKDKILKVKETFGVKFESEDLVCVVPHSLFRAVNEAFGDVVLVHASTFAKDDTLVFSPNVLPFHKAKIESDLVKIELPENKLPFLNILQTIKPTK